jgi:ubiquinone/menaquinone biosynthesis C-methylase UbiE
MVQAAREAGLLASGVEPGEGGVMAAAARGIHLERATAEDLPFGDNSFDIVHSHHVFEHVADPVRAAREAFRLLKPGGMAYVEVPNQFDNIRFWRDRLLRRVPQRPRSIRSVHHLSFFSRRTLRKLMVKAGFAHVEIESEYSVIPKGSRWVGGWVTMALGRLYLGGERIIAKGIRSS